MAALDQQHPIPQQISSYQFRLVGNMTLKQFFQIAGGALVSLLFYASNLPGLVKWPLVLFFSLLGVALAFLPFEERPLEKWIFAFFKSVYSPTLYFWKKSEKPPVFFKEEAPEPKEKIIAPHGEVALQKYLESLPGRGAAIFSKLEETEKSFLSKMARLFGPAPIAQEKTTTARPQIQKPTQELKIPKSKPTAITPPGFRPKIVVEEKQIKPVEPEQRDVTAPVTPTLAGQAAVAGQAAQFSVQAAPPIPPETPNTVTGQVMDAVGKIVEGAILEIKDVAGRPVRAVKTNKAGHFLTVTPLENGKYEIVIEKEGIDFDPLTFEATGSIIPPIAIRAKGRLEPTN